jgi:elongation factor G
VPLIAFINKMDKLGADFAYAVETIRQRLALTGDAATGRSAGSAFRGV